MRLIDADVVKQNILEVIKKQAGKSKDLIPVRELPLFIDIQPTVYSVDKIIEEFDKEYNNSLWIKGNEEFSITRNEMIEIVKRCGVDVANDATTKNDDVCEWKVIGANDNWSTSCDKNSTHNVFGVAWFKRCPYCGRKLKIVGDNDDD